MDKIVAGAVAATAAVIVGMTALVACSAGDSCAAAGPRPAPVRPAPARPAPRVNTNKAPKTTVKAPSSQTKNLPRPIRRADGYQSYPDYPGYYPPGQYPVGYPVYTDSSC